MPPIQTTHRVPKRSSKPILWTDGSAAVCGKLGTELGDGAGGGEAGGCGAGEGGASEIVVGAGSGGATGGRAAGWGAVDTAGADWRSSIASFNSRRSNRLSSWIERTSAMAATTGVANSAATI